AGDVEGIAGVAAAVDRHRVVRPSQRHRVVQVGGVDDDGVDAGVGAGNAVSAAAGPAGGDGGGVEGDGLGRVGERVVAAGDRHRQVVGRVALAGVGQHAAHEGDGDRDRVDGEREVLGGVRGHAVGGGDDEVVGVRRAGGGGAAQEAGGGVEGEA